MANIDKELHQIKHAVYGREVRGSIHDGIKKINEEVEDNTETSEQAKHQVENIQEQVDNLVVSGDSSVEAAQARVDKDNHNYSTLKERLDTEQQQFETQLAETVSGVVNVKAMFGAVGDGIVDDTEAIQSALNLGGEVLLPKGTYRITDELVIKNDYTYLVGSGVPEIIYDGEFGGSLIRVNSDYIGKPYEDVQIKNLYLNGNHKSKWLLNLHGFSFNCLVDNVHLSRSIGAIYATNCFYSTWHKVYVWSQTDGCPEGFPLSDWEDVHNNNYTAPITFRAAHSSRISNFHVGSIGTSLDKIPSGKENTYKCMHVEGYDVTLTDLSFEGTRDKNNKTITVNSLIELDYGGLIDIKNVYMEAIHVNDIINFREYVNGPVTIRNIYFEKSSFGRSFIRNRYFSNTGITLDGVTGIETNLPKDSGHVVDTLTIDSVTVKNVSFMEGKTIKHNNKLYDNPSRGNLGITGASINKRTSRIPYVTNGLDITYSGNTVYIDSGAITSDMGERIRVGQKSFVEHSNSFNIGKSFTMDSSGTWNVCVDRWGMVFVEEYGNPRSSELRGKIILAEFTSDSSGKITGLTERGNNGSNANGALVSVQPGFLQNIPKDIETAVIFDRLIQGNSNIYKSSEPTKLYVPAGVSKVRLTANIAVSPGSGEGHRTMLIKKNGSSFPGMPNITVTPIAGKRIYLNAVSGIVDVEYGDYFEVYFEHDSDSSVDVGGASYVTRQRSSWFHMEVFR